MRWVMVITLLIISSDVFGQFAQQEQRYTNEELKLLVKEGQVVENLLLQKRHYVLFVGDLEQIYNKVEQTNKEYELIYLEEGIGDVYSFSELPEYVIDTTFFRVLTNNYGDTLFMGLAGETEWVNADSVYRNKIELNFISTICYEWRNVSVDVCNE